MFTLYSFIMSKKSVLIFGVGPLQKSIIGRAKKMGLYTVGIDPAADATCKDDVDAFEVVGGQDFEGTCAVVEKYGIDAIVTAATDKPLVMMARIAEKYGFPFYSVETAQWSTDKFQMKQRFMEGGVPCAKGRLVKSVNEVEDFEFPVIVKPRDNSGSRGVKFCNTPKDVQKAIDEALPYSHLDSVLVEEYIDGQEYSIEGLHYKGHSDVVQFTEKTTTTLPYNVELAHKQPANLTIEQQLKVKAIIAKIDECMKFKNCPSHTELKINDRGIYVIETSPRLGGGNITSHLVPLSTGINMEDKLLEIALGAPVSTTEGRIEQASGVRFLQLPVGRIENMKPEIDGVYQWEHVVDFQFDLQCGAEVQPLKTGLDRYGQFIVQTEDRATLDSVMDEYNYKIMNMITISTPIQHK